MGQPAALLEPGGAWAGEYDKLSPWDADQICEGDRVETVRLLTSLENGLVPDISIVPALKGDKN